jgi:DNA-binding transcriptional ArsR family regulator
MSERQNDDNITIKLFNIVARNREPVKELLAHAVGFVESRDYINMKVIDNLLTGVLVRLIRTGSKDDLDSSVLELLDFIGSRDEGEKADDKLAVYLARWKHLYEVLDRAAGKYDHNYAERFISSRKHGRRLMELLRDNPEGLTVSALAEMLDKMAVPQLSRMLVEFEEFGLIERIRDGRNVTARLSIIGLAYIEKESEPLANGRNSGHNFGHNG